ncbi:uncharacterized protein DFL_002142 [Arthrobotrys flagrans]|uniref:Mid2 domain-containing protein n=1 Tax=Arthrobotrys flagrans TaxID=97331 RepID=A0A437AAM8_ARTFL|nr:hypothetical protein DFL_002142 [Arthrobotrys flagrans]
MRPELQQFHVLCLRNDVNAFFCYFEERNNDGEHCEQRSDVFTLVGGNSIRTTIGVVVSTQISTVKSIETSIKTSIKTSIATIFVTPSPSPSPTPRPPSVNTSPPSRTTTSDATAPADVSNSASSSSGPNPDVIGGAVGGSMGAVCLCLFAYLAYMFGKRRQADRMTPSEPMWQLPHGPSQAHRRHPTNVPIPSMAVHQVPPTPASPRPALAPGPIPPPPAGGQPPGYAPYNPQLFGPPLT